MKMKKFAFQLDTPFSTTTWPQVNIEDQDALLELLCTLLSPLGNHRSKHIQTSKGKREKKRKRKEAEALQTQNPSPPAPEISSYVDVGLASVTRRLQATTTRGQNPGSDLDKNPSSDELRSPFYSIIFVARSGQPSALNSHLPQMVAVASKSDPSRQPTRLVGLSMACQGRLSESIGIPRISCIGLHEEATGSKALVDFARQHVPVIELQWLKEARDAEYKDTKINTVETLAGTKKQARRCEKVA